MAKRILKNKTLPSKKEELVSKSQVQNMIRSSKANLIKFVDTDYTLTSAGAIAPNIVNLGMPVTGTGNQDMSGTSIKIEKFDICYSTTFAQTALTQQWVQTRLVLYQNNTDVPVSNVSDICENASTAVVAMVSPLSYDNKNYSFKPLLDETQNLTLGGIQARLSDHKSLIPSIPLARFNSINGTWTTGQPAVFFAAPSSAAVTSNVVTTFWIRMWFYDV